jgi:hypothetical protein
MALTRFWEVEVGVDDVKEYGGVEVQFHSFLTSAIDGHEWSDSRPSRFSPGE